jgi:predicted GIY-YIG superfamily endonuclease
MAGRPTQNSSNLSERFGEVACPEPVEGFSFVYILQSDDGTYYVGQTRDLRERSRKHRIGLGAKHTSDHPGCRLVYWEGPFPLTRAVSREAQLKRWTRAKKEALVLGNAASLRSLSKSRD